METKVAASARIRLELEIDWKASFTGMATASDIYKTAARECQNSLERALQEGNVRFRIIGDIQPLMVIYPVKDPK